MCVRVCVYVYISLKNVGPIRHNEPPHANSPDVASGTVTPPAHRCLRRQRQRVTEGTAMAPWNGPNDFTVFHNVGLCH